MTIAISGFFGWMLLIIFVIFSIILIFLWFTLALAVSQKFDEIVGEARAAVHGRLTSLPSVTTI